MDLSLLTYHFILPMLDFFKNALGSYGWSIIVVTLLVKVILYPLTKHQTESMKKMQALQPRIKILQDRFNQQKEKYKDRPAKLKEAQATFQKEMMEFYQTNKVNPLGGCLPMLIQLPILIALFWAFNGSPFKPVAVSAPVEILDQDHALAEKRIGKSKPQIYVDSEGRKGRFVITPGEVKIPAGTKVDYKIFKLQGNVLDVSHKARWQLSSSPYYVSYAKSPDLHELADIEIGESPENAILVTKKPGKFFIHALIPASSGDESFLFISGLGKTGPINPDSGTLNIDVVILVLLFALTIWLSGKVTSGYSPPPADPKQAQMQKMMQTMMPPFVAMMILFFPVPAGVLLYFVASGFIQVLQTWLIMRKPITS